MSAGLRERRGDRPAGWRVLDRVREEIVEDLFEAKPVPVHPARLVRSDERDQVFVLVRRRTTRGEAGANHLGEVDARALDRDLSMGHARHVEEVVDEPREVRRLTVDDQLLPSRVADPAAHRLDRHPDRREGVPELVPEHRQELLAKLDRATRLVLASSRTNDRLHREDHRPHVDGTFEDGDVTERHQLLEIVASDRARRRSEDDNRVVGPLRLPRQGLP